MRRFLIILLVATALAAKPRPTTRPPPVDDSTEDEYYDTDDETPVPPTSFTCQDRHDGFYADVEANCRVFHYCQTFEAPGLPREQKDWPFICPTTTIFRQQYLTCATPDGSWGCEDSEQYFNATESPVIPTRPPGSIPLPTQPSPPTSQHPTEPTSPQQPSEPSQPPTSQQPSEPSSPSDPQQPTTPSSSTPTSGSPLTTEGGLQLDDGYLLPPLLPAYPVGSYVFPPASFSTFTKTHMPSIIFEHFKGKPYQPQLFIDNKAQTLDEYQKKISLETKPDFGKTSEEYLKKPLTESKPVQTQFVPEGKVQTLEEYLKKTSWEDRQRLEEYLKKVALENKPMFSGLNDQNLEELRKKAILENKPPMFSGLNDQISEDLRKKAILENKPIQSPSFFDEARKKAILEYRPTKFTSLNDKTIDELRMKAILENKPPMFSTLDQTFDEYRKKAILENKPPLFSGFKDQTLDEYRKKAILENKPPTLSGFVDQTLDEHRKKAILGLGNKPPMFSGLNDQTFGKAEIKPIFFGFNDQNLELFRRSFMLDNKPLQSPMFIDESRKAILENKPIESPMFLNGQILDEYRKKASLEKKPMHLQFLSPNDHSLEGYLKKENQPIQPQLISDGKGQTLEEYLKKTSWENRPLQPTMFLGVSHNPTFLVNKPYMSLNDKSLEEYLKTQKTSLDYKNHMPR